MEILYSFKPNRKKTILSTRRKMKVLSLLNSDCRKCFYNDKFPESNKNTFEHGKEVFAFLQKEQLHVECLKELKKFLLHPVLKGNITSLKDIIGLIDEMLSIQANVYNVLISGKSDLPSALKQLSSSLELYASYSMLFSLEKSNFQEITLQNDICMDMDLFQEPITHISRCKDLFQNLYRTIPEEVYGNMLKAAEIVLSNIQNELFLRENTIRIIKIQRSLFGREPKILSPGRTVLKEGILHKVNCKGRGLKARMFFLFNDIFLCCKILSRTFICQEKNSLLFRALFPLNMCSVSLVMGSSNQGNLFKVTCGTTSYLLISKIPGEAHAWFHELQTAIRICQKPNKELKPKLNRRNIRIKFSPFLKQGITSENVFDDEKNKT